MPLIRLLTALIIAWCVMLETHELGHIVGGYLSGGKLQAVDVWPWHLPYSLFQPDPHPLVTLWSGLISGVLVPLLLALLIRKNWAWFIAGFCLLANGLYIAVGWWSGDPFLDTTKLLEHGSHPVSLAVYCAVTIGFGYNLFRSSLMQLLINRNELKDSEENSSSNSQ